jgi:hypothetical protein
VGKIERVEQEKLGGRAAKNPLATENCEEPKKGIGDSIFEMAVAKPTCWRYLFASLSESCLLSNSAIGETRFEKQEDAEACSPTRGKWEMVRQQERKKVHRKGLERVTP